jgi:hypothetical protein
LLVGVSCTENPIRRGWTGVAVTAQQTKLISISFLCTQAASTPHNFCCCATCNTSVTKFTRLSRTKLPCSLIAAAGGNQEEGRKKCSHQLANQKCSSKATQRTQFMSFTNNMQSSNCKGHQK